jgi:hypothetical protein
VEFDYPAGISEHKLGWKDFELTTPNGTARPMPAPFDGMTVAGERKSGQPLVIESMCLLKP